MNKLPTDIDRGATDGLSSEEMASLLVAYAQENAHLEAEVDRLTRKCACLEKIATSRLQYIRDVRATEAAVRKFVADPAMSPYIPDLQTVRRMIFAEPREYQP